MTGLEQDKPVVNMRTFEGRLIQDKYLLEKYVGGGNFGAVFQSRQHFLTAPIRRVAVKISRHTAIDLAKAREIFADVFMLAEAMDEMADATAREHLIHIYDAGLLPEEGNRIFVVMEYVQGTDLTHQFRSYKRVPENLLLKWVRQICLALNGLHQLSPPVIHRDLKPDNVLLGADNNVRLADFGLAARLLSLGYVPGVAGTITYMAPETTRGESTPASDVYSLGLIMYEGLTGRLPFDHLIPPIDLPDELQSDWMYQQKARLRIDPPSTLNNTVSPKLDEIVLRCLEFDQARRYYNAGELLKALDAPAQGPEDVAALKEGSSLRAASDLAGARRCLERGLGLPSTSKETRFALLREHATVLVALGDPRTALGSLLEAWKLTENRVILRTREERAGLLGEIEITYTRLGNSYQADRYRDLKNRELQRRGN